MLPNTLYYSSVFQSLFDKPTSTLKFPQTTQLPTQIKKLKKKSPPVFSLHLFPLQKSQTISPHPLVTHTLPTHKSLQRFFFFFFYSLSLTSSAVVEKSRLSSWEYVWHQSEDVWNREGQGLWVAQQGCGFRAFQAHYTRLNSFNFFLWRPCINM